MRFVENTETVWMQNADTKESEFCKIKGATINNSPTGAARVTLTTEKDEKIIVNRDGTMEWQSKMNPILNQMAGYKDGIEMTFSLLLKEFESDIANRANPDAEPMSTIFLDSLRATARDHYDGVENEFTQSNRRLLAKSDTEYEIMTQVVQRHHRHLMSTEGHSRNLKGGLGEAFGTLVDGVQNLIGTDVELGMEGVNEGVAGGIAEAGAAALQQDYAGVVGGLVKAGISALPDELGGADISGAKNFAYTATDAAMEVAGYVSNPIAEGAQAAVKFSGAYGSSDADSFLGKVYDGVTGASSTVNLAATAIENAANQFSGLWDPIESSGYNSGINQELYTQEVHAPYVAPIDTYVSTGGGNYANDPFVNAPYVAPVYPPWVPPPPPDPCPGCSYTEWQNFQSCGDRRGCNDVCYYCYWTSKKSRRRSRRSESRSGSGTYCGLRYTSSQASTKCKNSNNRSGYTTSCSCY